MQNLLPCTRRQNSDARPNQDMDQMQALYFFYDRSTQSAGVPPTSAHAQFSNARWVVREPPALIMRKAHRRRSAFCRREQGFCRQPLEANPAQTVVFDPFSFSFAAISRPKLLYPFKRKLIESLAQRKHRRKPGRLNMPCLPRGLMDFESDRRAEL